MLNFVDTLKFELQGTAKNRKEKKTQNKFEICFETDRGKFYILSNESYWTLNDNMCMYIEYE